MLDIAEIRYFEGRFKECLEICLKILESPHEIPHRERVLTLASHCALKLKSPHALELCLQAYSLHSHSYFYALNVAKASNLTQNYQQACQILISLLNDNDNPIKAEFALTLLESYKAQKLYNEADFLYRKLLQECPKSFDLWLDFGQMYQSDAPKKALEIYLEAQQTLTERIRELSAINPTYTLQQDSLSARLGKTLYSQENPEIPPLQNFLIKLKIQIAKTYLEFFEIPLLEAQNALEILQPIEESLNSAESLFLFAMILEYTGHYKKSDSIYQKALTLAQTNEIFYARIAFSYAYFLMRQGDKDGHFKKGLELYEYRLKFANPTTFSLGHYEEATEALKQDKNALKDKIICVYCEQGFGDTLMFSRVLEPLCQIAKQVLFCPQSALYPLFAHLQSQEKAFKNLTLCQSIPHSFDFAIPLTSIPHFLGLHTLTKLNQLKSPLSFPKRKYNLSKTKKIGFFWHTNFAIKEPNSRNFHLDFFLNFLSPLKNVELVSLQVGDFQMPDFIINRGASFKHWLDTYEALQDIDCVVGIDSSPAHLSILCGIPTLIVLQPRFDWRFGPYEAPKAQFYKDNVHCFVANPNDTSAENKITKKLTSILESQIT